MKYQDADANIDDMAISKINLICDLCGKIIPKGTHYLEVKDSVGITTAHRDCDDYARR